MRHYAPPTAAQWVELCSRLLDMNRAGRIEGLRINGGKITFGKRDAIGAWHWRQVSFDQAVVLSGLSHGWPVRLEPWQVRNAECAARRSA